MFRSSIALLGLFCVLSFSTFDDVRAASAPIPKPPDVNARAYILVDYQSGRVLAEEHADDRMEPASLTKLMTAYVVFTALKEPNRLLRFLASMAVWPRSSR